MIGPGIAVSFVCAFVISLLLTRLNETIARRVGLVARPSADRWHTTPVPLMGGVAIVLGTLGPLFAFVRWDSHVLVLAFAALGVAVVGFADDVYRLNPQAKLLGQILFAVLLLHLHFEFRLTGYPLVDIFVTIFWIVGITNAFNLLDNMDGLAASIAAVVGIFRLVVFSWDGDDVNVCVAAIFVGAVTGFLVRNFPPAKIFMGDTGSLFLGFFLAGLSLAGGDRPYSRSLVAVVVIPVLLMLIPIFDTAFVTATRILAGRRPTVGGRDHTSHRLVAVGLSPRQTVTFLMVISAAAGGLALLSHLVGLTHTIVLLALLLIGLTLLGIYLSWVRVVQEVEPSRRGAALRLLEDFPYKRQVATLLLDVCLIVLAYYAAFIIRFDDEFPRVAPRLYDTLPLVLLVQLTALSALGVYRGIWQYTSLSDSIRIIKAITIAMLAIVVMRMGHEGLAKISRMIFVLDWLVLIVFVTGSRLSFRLFGEMFRPRPPSFQRVLVYGAGGGGAMITREILNNRGLQRTPIGFIDDDRTKHRTRIHGLPVFGGVEQIARVIRERSVGEVIISSRKISGDRLERTARICEGLDVEVRRGLVRFE
jgi:UDP-GlcNAc:undecaprenyl-phosphate/decaprenyl-phosphate GlcNAc-1-phosphate transferase